MAEQYSPTACGTLRKHSTKPSEQVSAPDCTVAQYSGRPAQWMEVKNLSISDGDAAHIVNATPVVVGPIGIQSWIIGS